MALGLIVMLFAAPVFGQGPLGFQLFPIADMSTYGGAIEPNEGYFAQVDFLYWNLSQSRSVDVGFPGLTREVVLGVFPSDVRVDTNTLDTSVFPSKFVPGVRYEFGRIEDRNGWFVSIIQKMNSSQTFFAPSANIALQEEPFGPYGLKQLMGVVDPNGGSADNPLPLRADNITMNHNVNMWNVELMYLHRFRTRHEGGTFEFFMGPRYMKFSDEFDLLIGDSLPKTVPSYLQGSAWANQADNHIIGGQVGGRWFKKQGRWMLSAEGRFLAALNCQNIHQIVNFGPNLNPGITETDPTDTLPRTSESAEGQEFSPWLLGGSTSTYDEYEREWTPGVELRFEARYQITRAISFHAGWTGIWLDGIARGDSTIDYTLHDNGQIFGIDTTRNRQDLFMHGFTMGFDVNR